MTEYDYSPAALEAWRKKQATISKWASHTSLHAHPPNPFTPSDRPRTSDFYSKPSTPSEIYGPDRPPSPPRSAPPVGYGAPGCLGGGGGGYFAGYPSARPVVLTPRWNGHAWVYDSTSSRASSPRPEPPRRPKAHRRRSVSGPPAMPPYAYGAGGGAPLASAPPVSYHSNGVRVNVVNVSVPHATIAQPRPQYYRALSWQQPKRSSSSLSMAYPPNQPVYGGGAPVVIVDGARKKGGKLRKGTLGRL